jgi:hypothetical protein
MSKLIHYQVTYKFVDSDVSFTKYLLAEDDHAACIMADDLKDDTWIHTDIKRT